MYLNLSSKGKFSNRPIRLSQDLGGGSVLALDNFRVGPPSSSSNASSSIVQRICMYNSATINTRLGTTLTMGIHTSRHLKSG
jgi:hypothetical protein